MFECNIILVAKLATEADGHLALNPMAREAAVPADA